MIEADGTKDKSNLGANAISCRFYCNCKEPKKLLLLTFRLQISKMAVFQATDFPVPMMNILNGGGHTLQTL